MTMCNFHFFFPTFLQKVNFTLPNPAPPHGTMNFTLLSSSYYTTIKDRPVFAFLVSLPVIFLEAGALFAFAKVLTHFGTQRLLSWKSHEKSRQLKWVEKTTPRAQMAAAAAVPEEVQEGPSEASASHQQPSGPSGPSGPSEFFVFLLPSLAQIY